MRKNKNNFNYLGFHAKLFIGIGVMLLIFLLACTFVVEEGRELNFGIHATMNLMAMLLSFTIGGLCIFFQFKPLKSDNEFWIIFLFILLILAFLGVNVIIIAVNPYPYETANALVGGIVFSFLLIFVTVGYQIISLVLYTKTHKENKKIAKLADIKSIDPKSKKVAKFDVRFVILTLVYMLLLLIPISSVTHALISEFAVKGGGVVGTMLLLIIVAFYIMTFIYCIIALIRKNISKAKRISVPGIWLYSILIALQLLLIPISGIAEIIILCIFTTSLVTSILLLTLYGKRYAKPQSIKTPNVETNKENKWAISVD